MKQEHKGRAKQFMPFAALKGFEEAVSEAERLTEPRRELSETQAAELSDALSAIKKGDTISVTHYVRDRYVTTCGRIALLDTVFRFMKLNSERIYFDDIIEVERPDPGQVF